MRRSGRSKSHVILAVATIVVALLAGSAVADDWEAVVLKVKSKRDGEAGNLIVELASGRTLELAAYDWSSEWTQAVTNALNEQELKVAAQASTGPPSDTAAAPLIRSKL